MDLAQALIPAHAPRQPKLLIGSLEWTLTSSGTGSSGCRLNTQAGGSQLFDHGHVKNATSDELLSQLEVVENRWIAERDEDGAPCFRRVGTMNGIWLDIDYRALGIRDAFANEVTVENIRHFSCSFVYVSWYFAPWLHCQEGHCWTEGLFTI